MSGKNSTRNLLIALVIVFIVALVAAVLSQNVETANDAVASGALSFSEEEWNLGDVSMRDGIDTKDVVFTNSGSAPITVTHMSTSCMCTNVQIIRADGEKSPLKGMVGHGGTPAVSEVINPNETATLRVQFDPNAHGPNATGYITRTLDLKTNSKDQGNIQLSFSGNVTK